jgi:hypothetical protein
MCSKLKPQKRKKWEISKLEKINVERRALKQKHYYVACIIKNNINIILIVVY